MRAIRNVLLAVGCVVLAIAMVSPASAGLITGIQYEYDPGGWCAGAGAATENAFTGGNYTTTSLSSGILKDGYITTQADINSKGATTACYYIGNGPAGAGCIYGTGDGPAITFNLNGSYNLSSMLIGYTIQNSVGVYARLRWISPLITARTWRTSLVSITVPTPTAMATLGRILST